MSEVFSSKALEANLTRTRDAIPDIPEDQKWFMELSKSKWGIYKRTQDFLTELNHKYRNDQYVIDALHTICLEDIWLYNSLEESEKALSVLVDIFRKLLALEMEDAHRELLIRTLIKFMDRLSSLENFPETIIFQCLDIIRQDMRSWQLLYVRNSGYFKSYLINLGRLPIFKSILFDLTSGLLDECIDYWERTSNAEEWFRSKRKLFRNMDETVIGNIGAPFFNNLRQEKSKADSWEKLVCLMFYNDISNYFRGFTDRFTSSLEAIYYIYYLLHLPGMSLLNDHLLYDMNRNLRNVFKEIDMEDIKDFLDTLMAEFSDLKEEHFGTVLDCISTLGKEVINKNDQSSISYFTKGLISLGFAYPGELKLNEDWQTRADPNHVKNIRVWLELIGYAPSSMRELLAALIANMKLGGIFISDTDLFQRDVTKLLNSDIKPVFREIKQLARIFPIYFRDIGAEGELREATTAMDELCMRKDRLIHFLRKQIHTESNNTHIALSKRIIQYWEDRDKEPLRGMVPDDIFDELGPRNKWLSGVHEVLTELCRNLGSTSSRLLNTDMDELRMNLDQVGSGTEKDHQRVLYIFRVYSMLLEKYSLESEDILSTLKNGNHFNPSELESLKKALDCNDCEESVRQIYRMMNKLKGIILDPGMSEALENIYYKRHIAVGIPSMYGQYMEPKFEALGLMYRLERTAAKLMTQVVQPFNSEYITAKTFRRIYDILLLFREGLELDGIYNPSFNSHLNMLKYGLTSPSFSLDQFINIFQFIGQDMKQIIREYFFDFYDRPLSIIIPQIVRHNGLEGSQMDLMESEKFLRDNLSSAFLVQELDNFITDIINALRTMIDNYSESFIENMMTYDPDLAFSLLSKKSEEVDNPVFLGAKAFFLKQLITYGLPVPPGFVITTEVFRHRETITRHPYMNEDFNRLIRKNISDIEKITGQAFGRPENPLLLSVRSGSSISMPGAMKTFLNVGMNDEIAAALSHAPGMGWTAWDCYRRFLQSWGMAFGIERDVFDRLISDHKEKYGVELKAQFTKEQMMEVAYAYKAALGDFEVQIESDPFIQLKHAIRGVLDSWGSESAAYYREHMQIADGWGTAILVQKMVLGNLPEKAGTGVILTNSPFNEYSGVNLYGDFTLCGQGEDVVSGLVDTLPISEHQRKNHYKDSSISLESEFPQIYESLKNHARQLIEKEGYVHQEIEFTFESDHPEGLYILQTRNQNLKKQKTSTSFVPSPNEMLLAGHGIGVSSGALSGFLAFDMEDMNLLKEKQPDGKIILVRPDTVPDDIPLIFICDGLVTAKGGVTSHAAVAAAGLGKVCIVKCRGLIVYETEKRCILNGHAFGPGDQISIDGSLGNVYEGNYEILKS